MFAQPVRESDYSQMLPKPGHYSQNLWKVNDTELYKPGERFIRANSPYLESIFEQGLSGPLESAPLPKGMVRFITDVTRRLGVVPSAHSSPEEIAAKMLSFLDYSEPYYLFVDSAVQLNQNQLKYTYRVKESGGVLAPDQIECFGVVYGYDFKHYHAAEELLNNPKTQEVLQGGKVIHQVRGDWVTLDDVFEQLTKILYGSQIDHLQSWVEEWLYEFYEGLRYSASLTDEELLTLDTERLIDTRYWSGGILASLMWLRSSHALPFLIEYQPIYASVLHYDPETCKTSVVPDSGGEAVVEGWNVYTRRDLLVEQNTPPGTCESCKNTLHCTKYVNAQALFYPDCSCGKVVPLEDTAFGGHDWQAHCKPYLNRYPPFPAFVCQRCMYMALNKLRPETTRCQRTTCPATQCPNHAGRGFYLQELTKRRTMMLTHMQPQ